MADNENCVRIHFGEAFRKIPMLAMANFWPLAANMGLFLLVVPIPWMNAGAWFGLYAVSGKMTSAGGLRPAEVLQPKYREWLRGFKTLFGELPALSSGGFFVCQMVLMMLAWPCVAIFSCLFESIAVATRSFPMPLTLARDPAAQGIMFIVISLMTALFSLFSGGLLAPLLVFEKDMPISEALTKSKQLMSGNKKSFSLICFSYALIFGALAIGTTWVSPSFEIILVICIFYVHQMIFLAGIAYFYGKLTEEMESAEG